MAQHKTCIVEGCEKYQFRNKMCSRHNQEHEAKAEKKPWSAPVIKITPKVDTAPAPDDIIDEIPKDDNIESIITRALNDAWAVKRQQWLDQLAELKPGAAICQAGKMITAIEGVRI